MGIFLVGEKVVDENSTQLVAMPLAFGEVVLKEWSQHAMRAREADGQSQESLAMSKCLAWVDLEFSCFPESSLSLDMWSCKSCLWTSIFGVCVIYIYEAIDCGDDRCGMPSFSCSILNSRFFSVDAFLLLLLGNLFQSHPLKVYVTDDVSWIGTCRLVILKQMNSHPQADE